MFSRLYSDLRCQKIGFVFAVFLSFASVIFLIYFVFTTVDLGGLIREHAGYRWLYRSNSSLVLSRSSEGNASDDGDHGNRPPSPYGDKRRTRIDKPTGGNMSSSHVWPVENELDNRIDSQLDFLRDFARNVNGNKSTKVILRVGNFNFNFVQWKDGSKHLVEMKCPITACSFTSNLSLAGRADALVISEFGWKERELFTPKPANQIWIAQHLEAPLHNRINPRSLNGLVNWTATYRPDSTIVLPYGRWVPVRGANTSVASRLSGAILNYAKGRTKKVIWFVSSCQNTNERGRYAWELGRFIDVDIFGKCGGTSSCPNTSSSSKPPTKDECFDAVKRDYKFYLSFENSNCFGYITEKLHWNALSHDMVPIVLGARREDYASMAPPGSYIHVEDFQSPHHLANYLKILDSNDTLYNEYFTYKRQYRHMEINDTLYWCRLCGLLHARDALNYTFWYDDYEKWWNGGCSVFRDGRNPWKTWKPGRKTSKTGELMEILLSLP